MKNFDVLERSGAHIQGNSPVVPAILPARQFDQFAGVAAVPRSAYGCHRGHSQTHPPTPAFNKNDCPVGARNTNRAQTQGAGLSCVSSRISSQIRQYDSQPCPERQVEKLSLLLWPM